MGTLLSAKVIYTYNYKLKMRISLIFVLIILLGVFTTAKRQSRRKLNFCKKNESGEFVHNCKTFKDSIKREIKCKIMQQICTRSKSLKSLFWFEKRGNLNNLVTWTIWSRLANRKKIFICHIVIQLLWETY